jgi:glutamate decarboxylase
MGQFELIGPDEEQLPLVAFRLAERPYDEFDIAWQLSAERAGWCPPTPCRRTPRT